MENVQTSTKASIIAIGTELTTGQVTNRNAAWISEQLTQFGIEVVLHVTVADDRTQILNALSHCRDISEFLFVTGGLGPTSDDFTREVIAQFLNQELVYDELSWKRIVERLSRFGISIAESNRQQCFFPKDAQIIPNPQGTASAFTTLLGQTDKRLWVLPGPPREIQAIWENSIHAQLLHLCENFETIRLFTWQCLGKSEAELGEITEKALHGSQLKIGYRAHSPFVEIKVWCPESQVQNMNHWLSQLDQSLSPWVHTRQGEDLAERLIKNFDCDEEIEIFDAATYGLLAQRLGSALKMPKIASHSKSIFLTTEWGNNSQDPNHWISHLIEQASPDVITLGLAGFTPDSRAIIGLKYREKQWIDFIQSPYRYPEHRDRTIPFIIEKALKKWCDWTDTSLN